MIGEHDYDHDYDYDHVGCSRTDLPRCLAIIAALLLGLLSPATGRAQGDVRQHPLDDFGANLADSLTENGAAYLAAAGVTVVFVLSGTDASLQRFFQLEDPLGQDVARWTLIVGNVSTLALSAGIYAAGLATDDDRLASGGAAGLQAVIINFLVTTGLKILSGRPGPQHHGRADGPDDRAPAWLARSDDPREFDLDPIHFNGGVFWPSGHTSSHFALASALVAFYPDEEWLPWVAYPISAFVGVAMIDGDFHWTSDVVAGAIVGHAIGWTVGRSFRRSYEAAHVERTSQTLPLRHGRLDPPRPIPAPVVWRVAVPF